jgi:hypothetical protein
MGGDALEDGRHVELAERRQIGYRRELAVQAHHGRPPHLEVDVGCAETDGACEESVEFHSGACVIGSGPHVL